MPSRPIRITDLPEEAAHVLNQNFRDVSGRLDDIQKVLHNRIAGTPTLAFGTVGANSCTEATAYVQGASQQLVAHANPVQQLGSNLGWQAYVSKQNQVTVRVCNHTTGNIAASTVKWQIVVA